MAQLRPFAGRLVTDGFATDVATPAHDAMTSQQRRAHVAAHTTTYLRVERTVGDGVTDTMDPDAVIREGRDALAELLGAGAFGDAREGLFLYRLETDDHRQTGIVAELSAADIVSGEVRPHEDVSFERARHLANHFEVVGAQSSPMLLGVRGRGALEARIEELSQRPPDLVVDAGDGVRQTIWRVTDPAECASLSAMVAGEPVYVIDGHHRVAATRLHSVDRPERESAQWTLAVVYPTSELRVYEYNRIVSSLGPVTVDEAAASLRDMGAEEPNNPGVPGRGHVHVHLAGVWYDVPLPPSRDDDVVARLDPARVEDALLPKAFGIPVGDPDSRVAHVGPNTTPDQLAEQASRLGGAAIVLHPLDIDDVLAVADQGRFLPRKSTYFAPKARSGVFLRQAH